MIESFKIPNITPETLTGSIVSFNDEYGGLPLKSCTSLISGYQEGSGTPSPDNVRPLHAWSGASLTATGKNLLDINALLDNTGLDENTGAEISSNSTKVTPFIRVEQTNYFWNGFLTRIYYYRSDYSFIERGSPISNTSFTIPSDVAFIRLQASKANWNIDNLQLEKGNTATGYQEFGNTYTFTFGQSIYQGIIDWKRGVVTKAVKPFSFNSALYYGTYGDDNSNLYYVEIPNHTTEVVKLNARYSDEGVLVSNLFTKTTAAVATSMLNNEIRTNADSTPSRFYFRADSFDDLTALNNFLNTTPLQVMAELATPIEIPLGGINLLTQEGQNNIFCDTGDTTLEWLKVN